MKKIIWVSLSISIILIGFSVFYSALAQTEDNINAINESAILSKITFPIPELGNCASKTECKNFCDKKENIEACIVFAKKNGLMDEAEAARAGRFSKSLKTQAGPGGCTDPKSCKVFCSSVENLEVCLTWAEQNQITDSHFKEAKKIQTFIRSGGQMPGGCISKESCENYCGNFDHAEECIAFAEKAGLDIKGEKDGVPPKKVLELMKAGKTPGGCKSKKECDVFCGDQNNFEACLAFAEEAGFMNQEEATRIKKTGGKGPGGCIGKQACETYCNNPANQQACFKFAEENGLIKPEEIQKTKEGFSRMRAGLKNAPEEVRACLKENLGSNIIQNIESGNLVPGQEIGEKVKTCFEKSGVGFRPHEMFKDAPLEVLSCLTEKGIDVEKIKSGTGEFTPEMGDTFRVCFEASRFQFGGQGQNNSERNFDGPPPGFGDFLKTAPAEVKECFSNNLGADFEKIKSGELMPGLDIESKIRPCFESFTPRPHEGGNYGESSPGFMPPERKEKMFQNSPTNQGRNMPMLRTGIFPEPVAACLKSNLKEEEVQKLLRGDQPSGPIQEIIRKCFTEFSGMPHLQNSGEKSVPPPGFDRNNFDPNSFPMPPQGIPYPNDGQFQTIPLPPSTEGGLDSPSLLGIILNPFVNIFLK